VTGYWWPARPAGWSPPAELVDFLAAGPRPVFIGFGSMAPGHGSRLADPVLAAIRRAGVRAVVQAGWSGLDVGADDDVITVRELPHDWLFPQVAAVVHHSGAGTTAAGLRAGVPAVPVPVLADQPFWARRLTELGTSPGPLPLSSLTADRLAAALRAVTTDPHYAARATAIAARLSIEDGARPVVEWLAKLP
jgi:UDP:flavonoid glycosyltransferase YjiC (YdhE family)